MRRHFFLAVAVVLLMTAVTLTAVDSSDSSSSTITYGTANSPVSVLDATIPLGQSAEIHILNGSEVTVLFKFESELEITGIETGATGLSYDVLPIGYVLYGTATCDGTVTVHSDFEGEDFPGEIIFHIYDCTYISISKGADYNLNLLPDGKYAVGSMKYDHGVEGMEPTADGHLVGSPSEKGTFTLHIYGTVTNGAKMSALNTFYRITVDDAPVVELSVSSTHLYVVEGRSVGFTVGGSVSSGGTFSADVSSPSGNLSKTVVGAGNTVVFTADQVDGRTDVVVTVSPANGWSGNTVSVTVTVVDELLVGKPSPGRIR